MEKEEREKHGANTHGQQTTSEMPTVLNHKIVKGSQEITLEKRGMRKSVRLQKGGSEMPPTAYKQNKKKIKTP